jgi:hypothetical protein
MGNSSEVGISGVLDRLDGTQDVAEPAAARLGPRADVQSLWFASSAKPWRSLALLPASAKVDVGAISEELVEAAARAGAAVRLLDARELSIEQSPFVLERLAALSRESARVLVVLPHLSSHPASRVLLEASDAFLIFVPLGELPARSVQQLVQLCPPGRGLGAVAVHPKARRNR